MRYVGCPSLCVLPFMSGLIAEDILDFLPNSTQKIEPFVWAYQLFYPFPAFNFYFNAELLLNILAICITAVAAFARPCFELVPVNYLFFVSESIIPVNGVFAAKNDVGKRVFLKY